MQVLYPFAHRSTARFAMMRCYFFFPIFRVPLLHASAQRILVACILLFSFFSLNFSARSGFRWMRTGVRDSSTCVVRRLCVAFFFALYLVRSDCEFGASIISTESETATICREQLCRLIRNSNTRNSSKLQTVSHTRRINCQRTTNVMSAIADRIHAATDTHMLETLERQRIHERSIHIVLFTRRISFQFISFPAFPCLRSAREQSTFNTAFNNRLKLVDLVMEPM